MTTSAAAPLTASVEPRAPAKAGESEWTLRLVLAASVCIVIGVLWDISWHKTVGRDTFWTAPHLLEQFGAVLAGLSCGWLVLNTTFAGSPDSRATAVRFWGFRGPLGAWVTIWGTFVMITSAPFDNWWHNAYGLDVKIVSPPHIVLAMGMIAVELGAMLMLLAAQNRATSEREVRRLGWGYAFAGGALLTMVGTMMSEYASRANDMHSPLFYQVAAGAFPIFLVAFGRSGRLRLPATTAAVIYTAILLAMIWILPLFPAQAKLAPIYNPVSHMVPPEFPLLLVLPAFAIDLVLGKLGRAHDWLISLPLALGFLGILLLVQWYFALFLISPGARNWMFGADQWPYFVRPGNWRYEFWNLPRNAAGDFDLAVFRRGIGIAALIALVSTRLGLWWGNGMSRVRR